MTYTVMMKNRQGRKKLLCVKFEDIADIEIEDQNDPNPPAYQTPYQNNPFEDMDELMDSIESFNSPSSYESDGSDTSSELSFSFYGEEDLQPDFVDNEKGTADLSELLKEKTEVMAIANNLSQTENSIDTEKELGEIIRKSAIKATFNTLIVSPIEPRTLENVLRRKSDTPVILSAVRYYTELHKQLSWRIRKLWYKPGVNKQLLTATIDNLAETLCTISAEALCQLATLEYVTLVAC